MDRLVTVFTSFFFLLSATGAFAQAPLATAPDDAIIEGVVQIKLEESVVAAIGQTTDARGMVEQTTAEGVPLTGVASLDALGEEYGAVRIERVFRPAGKNEVRHRRFGLHRWYRITFSDASEAKSAAGVREAVAAYAAASGVEIAEATYEKSFSDGYEPGMAPRRVAAADAVRVMDITNDPLYDSQWHYHNTGQFPVSTPDADIDLPEAHNIQTGDARVVVSIHDGGIQYDHEDLAANMWINEGEVPGNGVDDDNNGFIDDVYGYNFANNQGTIIPLDHGTHVAGTVAAVNNNETGVAGVAGGDGTPGSGVRLMSAQVFGENGSGGFAESYVYAADMGAVISQNSWGYTSPGVYEQAVLDAIDYYIAAAGGSGTPLQGGLVIFAAGNDNSGADYYPGYYEPTVAVASTDASDLKSGFSNYGEWVDISAPGGFAFPYDEDDVLSTVTGNSYGYLAGTSMACPHASGVAALLVSQNFGATDVVIRDILESTTDDLDALNPDYAGLLGTGRINAFKALEGAEPDETPPGAVTDLTAVLPASTPMNPPQGTEVILTWTAPPDDADDPGSGRVDSYEIRYTTDGPIDNEPAFADATPVGAFPFPADPGAEQTFTVDELPFATEIWFALKAFDEYGNPSPLSNSPSVATGNPPVVSVAPPSLESTLAPFETATQTLTITNDGESPLEGVLDLDFAVGTQLDFAFTYTEDFPRGTEAPSLGRVPEDARPSSVPTPSDMTSNPVGISGFGMDALSGYPFPFAAFDLGTPGNVDHIGEAFFNQFPGAGAIGPDPSIAYTIDGRTLYQIDVLTGAFAEKGMLSAEQEFTGMTFDSSDSTFYGITADGNTSHLYRIDVDAVEATHVGQVTKVPGAIALAATDDGLLYTYGIVNDQLVRVDKATGEGTVVGSIGFDANFGQGMGYDEETETIYMAAFNNANFQAELRAVDPTTGATAFIGRIGSPDEFRQFGWMSPAGRFVRLAQSSVMVDPGQSTDLDVTFDASGLSSNETYTADVLIESNDPANPLVTVPTGLTVTGGAPNLDLTPEALAFDSVILGAEETKTIAIANEGTLPLHISTITSDNDDFQLSLPANLVVEPFRSAIVAVTFAPSAVGAITGTMTIESDDPDTPTATVPLEGEGVPSPVLSFVPDSLEASLTPNRDTTLTLTLANDGPAGSTLEYSFPAFAAQEALATPGLDNLEISHAGGPDNFGYQWIDSRAPGGPEFEWFDVSDVGETYPMRGSSTFTVPLPFPFPFYGEEQADITLTSDGYVTFGVYSVGGGRMGPIPRGHNGEYDNPDNFISPLNFEFDWESSGGSLYTYHDTSLGRNRYIIQYTDLPTWSTYGSGINTFQIVLYPDGRIHFQYKEVGTFTTGFRDVTVGIENADGTDGLEVIYGNEEQEWLQDSLAVTFTRLPESITAVNPATGALTSGQSQDVSVTLSSEGMPPELVPGFFLDSLLLQTNIPTQSSVSISTGIDVREGTPDLALDATDIDFGPVFAGDSTLGTLTFTNNGSGILEVTGITSDDPAFTPVHADGFALSYGQSASIAIAAFTPEETGPFSGTLTLETNDPDTPEVTVSLAGEGTPPPVVSAAPEDLSRSVVTGETRTDILTVSNTGEAPLTFLAAFDFHPQAMYSPEDVAVPAPEDYVNPTEDETVMLVPQPGTPSPAPAPLSPVPGDETYRLDDGTGERAFGVRSSSDFMWMNGFTVAQGATATITSISTAWGTPCNADQNCYFDPNSGPLVGHLAKVFLYEDPNDDGVPDDAVLLAEAGTEVESPYTNQFTSVPIPPTEVDGVFFVAVLYPEAPASTYVAPADMLISGEGTTPQRASWAALHLTPGEFDPEDLNANDTPPYLIPRLNWLLRAEGYPSFVSITPGVGTVQPGAVQEVAVQFDAAGLEVDTYEGNVDIRSNDPQQSTVAIPVHFDVTEGTYPFALKPSALDVTVDLPNGDSTATEQLVIANTTDEEQPFAIEVHRAAGSVPLDPSSPQFSPRGPLGVVAYGIVGPTLPPPAENIRSVIRFDLGTPGERDTLGSAQGGHIGEFLPGNDDHLYLLGPDLLTFDVQTGETTTIGTPEFAVDDDTWMDMAVDPTDGILYALSESALYTIDPLTAEATLVAQYEFEGGYGQGAECQGPNPPGLTSIAVDADGTLYGHENRYCDHLMTLDKDTGLVTDIGIAGIGVWNHTNGQMDYDHVTGQLYITIQIDRDNDLEELYRFDMETGHATLVRRFEGILHSLVLPSQGFAFIDPALREGVLSAGNEISVPVTIDASSLLSGSYEAGIHVVSEAAGASDKTVPLTLSVEADPEATFQPTALSYGELFVGDEVMQLVTLFNTGRDVLNVSDVLVNEKAFSVLDSMRSFQVSPRGSQTIPVVFAPTAVQEYSATLSIESDAPNGATLGLEGVGIPAPELAMNPESFDLRAYIGQTYERTLSISNKGGSPLSYRFNVESNEPTNVPSGPDMLNQVMFFEDFNDGIPGEWTVVDHVGNGHDWKLNTEYGLENYTDWVSNDADGTAATIGTYSGDYDTSLLTPVITATGDSLVLEFWTDYMNTDCCTELDETQRFDIDITTNGGQTWTNIARYEPFIIVSHKVLDLSNYVQEGEEFVIRWRAYRLEEGKVLDHLQIDNVTISNGQGGDPFPQLVTITPAADTLVTGETQEVTLAINATGRSAGTYEVGLRLVTNDPLNELQTVPFTLEVIEHLTVTPEPGPDTTRQVYPAEEFLVPLTVESAQDLGVRSFEFTLGFADPLFTALGVETEGTLSENAILSVNTDVPGEISVAAIDTTMTKAASADRTTTLSGDQAGKNASPAPLFTLAGEDTLLYVRLEAAETFGESELAFTDFLFNEGEPPVATETTTYEVGALYGDVSLDGAVAAFDVALVMDAVVGAIELTPIQELVADVSGNGETSAFDAALIMDFLLGRIECFPVEEGCEENAQGLAAKSETDGEEEEAPSVTGLLDWGAPERTQAPVTEGKGVAPEPEGYWLEVPIVVTPEEGAIKAVEVTAGIDTSAVRVEEVEASVPESWHLAHHVSEGGHFTLALAGPEPLKGGPVASVTLRVADAEEGLPFKDARYVFNEEEAQAVGTRAGAAVKTASVEGENAALTTTLPETFAVLGNYPNPTSGETRIGLDLPAPAEVTVSVYDALGRRVMERREELDAGAGRELRLDARSLLSGAYFYRLDAQLEGDRHVETGSFVLVR